jgi:2-C-methyl-D-erythritol 4-phosphate cytidylyltransferase
MLLLAAGRGSRFGGPVPKAFLRLRGEPLLVHSLRRLVAGVDAANRAQVLVVVHPSDRDEHVAPWLAELGRIAGRNGPPRFVDGGASRQESMQNGLDATDQDADLVLVHDAARALVPPTAVRACIDKAAAIGAALLAIPATDTQKKVDDGLVTATLDRTGIWLAQTPQVVRRELLGRAIANARSTGFAGTDDVSLVERLGAPVAVVPGSATNLKITHPGDLALAEAILAAGLA